MPITVRKATKDDVPTILKLMNGLAEYINSTKRVEVTLDDLYRDGGFGDIDRPYYVSLIAEDSDLSGPNEPPVAVGHAMCSYLYTWTGKALYMNDLFVKESHRSEGIGKIIFNAVIQHCKEMGCRRLEFLVYDWNPVQRFYEKQNAINVTKRDGYQVFRVDGIEPLSKQ